MRDLRSIAGWLTSELRAIGSYIRERQLWLALAAGLTAWALAYQPPYHYQMDIGGSHVTDRQNDDAPFLTGFNPPEPEFLSDNPSATPLRWTTDNATIRLPGIGGGPWRVSIAAAGRPDRAPVASRWDDGTAPATVTVVFPASLYRLQAAASRAGDLALHFATPPYKTPGEVRKLGFVMYRVEVGSEGWGRAPSTGQLALLAAALALVYALCRRLVFAPRGALAIALALAGLASALLLRERMVLTIFTPTLVAILAGAYALGIVLEAIYRRLPIRPRTKDRGPRRQAEKAGLHPSSFILHPSSVVGLVVLALILRLGGILHPHAIFSDLRMNIQNLTYLTGGEVYFTAQLPDDAGGGRAPYPPGQYIALAPAQLLLPSGRAALGLILKAGNSLADSLVVGLLWYLLRRSGCGERAALLGAAVYLLPVPILRSLSIGELANVFGQTLALPLLAVLAVHARRLSAVPAFVATVLLFGLGLLGHLGVTISLFCLLGYLGLIWLIRVETRRSVRALIGAGLLAGTSVALVYHTALLDVLRARVGGLSQPARLQATITFAEKLRGLIAALPSFGLHPLALALGLVGVALVALRPCRTRDPRPRAALGALLIAWWGGTLLSLGLLLVANQGVRWQQFLYPALCLGGGPTLAAMWRRGRVGRVVAGALLVFLLWYGLAFWVVQLRDYLH